MDAYEIRSYKGGISADPYKGVFGAFRFGSGLNIKKKEDTLTCNQAMKKISGSTVTELINFWVPASDGNLYGFGASGGVYRFALPSTVTKVWTYNGADTPVAVTGAAEFTNNNGSDVYVPYLYFATKTKVSRITLAKAALNAWATDVEKDLFTLKGDDDWHTMMEAMGDLCIADNNTLAMIDYEGNCAAGALAALDLPAPNRIKTMLGLDDIILLGSHQKSTSQKSYAWTWDKISDSWIKRRSVCEKSINSFGFGPFVLVQAGNKGALYYFDTETFQRIGTLPGTGAYVDPGGTTELDGSFFMAVNGTNRVGIYSYGRMSKEESDPWSLNLDYECSATDAVTDYGAGAIPASGITLGALTAFNGTLYLSWKKGTTYGVDIIDPDNKATGVYEGLVFRGDLSAIAKNFKEIVLTTNPLPTGCSIAAYYRLNGATNWSQAEMNDGNTEFTFVSGTKAIFSIDPALDEGGEEFEAKVILRPSGNVGPEVKTIVSLYESLGVE